MTRTADDQTVDPGSPVGPAHGHGHPHGHEHGHAHEHGLESYDHVQGGMPVLDIGGDIGALVAITDLDAVGTELYLRSEIDTGLSVHTGVWRRDLGTGVVAAAVFLELVEGAYWVLDGAGADRCRVEIVGGELAQLDLANE